MQKAFWCSGRLKAKQVCENVNNSYKQTLGLLILKKKSNGFNLAKLLKRLNRPRNQMLGYNYCNPNKDHHPPHPVGYDPFSKIWSWYKTRHKQNANVIRAQTKKIVVFSASVSHNAMRRGLGNTVF